MYFQAHVCELFNVILDLPSNIHLHPLFHVSLLQPYSSSSNSNCFLSPHSLEFVEGLEYKVEAILDSKFVHNKLYYLVGWIMHLMIKHESFLKILLVPHNLYLNFIIDVHKNQLVHALRLAKLVVKEMEYKMSISLKRYKPMTPRNEYIYP